MTKAFSNKINKFWQQIQDSKQLPKNLTQYLPLSNQEIACKSIVFLCDPIHINISLQDGLRSVELGQILSQKPTVSIFADFNHQDLVGKIPLINSLNYFGAKTLFVELSSLVNLEALKEKYLAKKIDIEQLKAAIGNAADGASALTIVDIMALKLITAWRNNIDVIAFDYPKQNQGLAYRNQFWHDKICDYYKTSNLSDKSFAIFCGAHHVELFNKEDARRSELYRQKNPDSFKLERATGIDQLMLQKNPNMNFFIFNIGGHKQYDHNCFASPEMRFVQESYYGENFDNDFGFANNSQHQYAELLLPNPRLVENEQVSGRFLWEGILQGHYAVVCGLRKKVEQFAKEQGLTLQESDYLMLYSLQQVAQEKKNLFKAKNLANFSSGQNLSLHLSNFFEEKNQQLSEIQKDEIALMQEKLMPQIKDIYDEINNFLHYIKDKINESLDFNQNLVDGKTLAQFFVDTYVATKKLLRAFEILVLGLPPEEKNQDALEIIALPNLTNVERSAIYNRKLVDGTIDPLKTLLESNHFPPQECQDLEEVFFWLLKIKNMLKGFCEIRCMMYKMSKKVEAV